MDDNSKGIVEEVMFEDEGESAQGQGSPVPKQSRPAPEPEIIQSVAFQAFSPGPKSTDTSNIDLLMDVTLPLSVQLGTSRMTVKEILALGPGSVIELDKAAGEPVDLFVNRKLIAKGEVVVIDENFGIRIVEIVSSSEEDAMR